jgi:ParB/RepB/Spo0J family partition protein
MSTSTKQQPVTPSTQSTSPTASLQIVSLAKIVPSKTNPRKSFEGPEFDELVDSIRAHGVLQPVLLRPMFDGDDGELAHFELVAGERRFRASLAAEKSSIPAMVQLLDDEQAMEIQIIENLQRKDVTAIEEAEGFQRLLKGLEATQEKLPITGRATRTELVQTIASRIGKSVRYVWARMKLVSLAPEVKQALEAGKIEASHADILVSFPPEKQKEIFIENFTEPVYGDDEPFDFELADDDLGKERAKYSDAPIAVRELKRRLEQQGLELKKASWKWQKDTDGGLPGAVVNGDQAPRCVGCEFNTATESGDVKKARCLNQECFDAKNEYFVQIEVRHAEEFAKSSGTKLLKVIGSYYDGYKKKGFVPQGEWKKVGRGSCEHDVDALQVNDEGSAEKVVHVCATKGCKVHFPRAARETKSPEQARADQERKAENAARLAIAKKVVAATSTLPEIVLRHFAMVIGTSWEVRGNIDKIQPGAQRELSSAKVSSTSFAQACVAASLAAFVYVGDYNTITRGKKEFEAAILNLGFDPQKERAAVAKATAEAADPKAPKKSKVPSPTKAAASPKTKTTKKAAKKAAGAKKHAAKKSSTKKGGR